MKRPRSRAAVALLCGLAGVAGSIALWPALGQESLLPPGFGDPEPSRPVTPSPSEPQRAPVDLLPSTTLTPPPPATPAGEAIAEAGDEDEQEGEDAKDEAELDLPLAIRRSVDAVGPLDQGFGLGPDAFGLVNGRFLGGLMRRIDAPIASRWESILLRRALLSHVPTPREIDPVDWVSERAWLLLRMGEADAARMLVQSVDVDRYSAKMYAVAAQVALATADPAALCPLVGPALTFSQEPIWPMANAMCTAMSGEASVSGAMIEQIRRRNVARGVDLLLAEKVVNVGGAGRRAVTIEWSGVDRLTAWRFGLATATAVDIPPPLFATVGPHVQAWRARAAMVPLAARIGPARVAAALGVFSNASLVDLYGALADETDPADLAGTDAARLRRAYAGEDDDERVAALRELWNGAANARDRYAAAILTARAAARIAPSDSFDADAASLVGAMFAAGLDIQAARWGRLVDAMDPATADPAWAILAVGAPDASVDIGNARVGGFVQRIGGHKARMLVAALAGLGRLSPRDEARLAESVALPLAQQDRWSRILEQAVRSRQPGTVAVLVAAGMQTRTWRGVPPRQFYNMISALRRVGLTGEARMIAAEAMTRL